VTESGLDLPSGTSALIAPPCGPPAIPASPRLSAPNWSPHLRPRRPPLPYAAPCAPARWKARATKF